MDKTVPPFARGAEAQRGATVVVKKDGGLSLEQPTFELANAQSSDRSARGLRPKREFFDMQQVRVGAGPGNDLKLDHPTVSSVHCEIVATERGFRVKDLGSTNGTAIDGVRILSAFINDGQTLQVGEVELVFKIARGTIKTPVSESTELHGAVGTSPAMRAVFSRIERVAKTEATVLINGETGTGKEVTAWSIYEASARSDKPFVVVDCGAIARNLIESELFGHEKGAFTGAHQKRIGAFERAASGTLFLDELGELELDLQPKLLRALERREIQRVGGESTISVDCRIIAATNRDLRSMVARGEFREDLYYRLAVVTLELPPLRERVEDIPLLVEKFLRDMGATSSDLPAGALARFVEHDWPGNARELKNAVERAVVLGEAKLLAGTGRPRAQAAASGPDSGTFTIVENVPYKEQKANVIADFEERYARLLVTRHKGNVSAAAREAGIDRMSLHKILQRYHLDAKELARES